MSRVQVQAGQARHQSQERAQDAQRGENARGHLRQACAAQRVDDRVLVDILRHVAGLAMRVAQLGVLQEVRPGGLHAVAQEVEVAPGFLLLVLLVFGDDHAGSAAQPARHAGERQQAARHGAEQHDDDSQVDQRIQRKDAAHQLEQFHLVFLPGVLVCLCHCNRFSPVCKAKGTSAAQYKFFLMDAQIHGFWSFANAFTIPLANPPKATGFFMTISRNLE